MTIVAHPTDYAGVRFRSRLEARWAATFDLCGWSWEYEPIDLNGWVPDFILDMPLAPVYVEVKPVNLAKDRWGLTARLLSLDDPSFDKALQYQRQHQILVLGIGPQTPSDFFACGCLTDQPDGADYSWWELHCSLAHPQATAFWREAGNRTQWRAR